ncbi:MAG TPA: HPr family phosphocarrier protein [Candidatus Blautia avicola]|uniref:HPr family phosphocarrier protein n=1 Tax=Candidatus Blautia avicola TaxID=2838483 RepID=A0A9D2TXP9_9FIRM|nr:HPr family phosphocarrier protein [Candidatus Blautia avicola]
MNEKKVCFHHIEEMKEFVSAACRCDFDIDIVSDRLVVDGKSILGVLSLNCDQDLHVRYDGTAPHFEEVLGKFAVA